MEVPTLHTGQTTPAQLERIVELAATNAKRIEEFDFNGEAWSVYRSNDERRHVLVEQDGKLLTYENAALAPKEALSEFYTRSAIAQEMLQRWRAAKEEYDALGSAADRTMMPILTYGGLGMFATGMLNLVPIANSLLMLLGGIFGVMGGVGYAVRPSRKVVSATTAAYELESSRCEKRITDFNRYLAKQNMRVGEDAYLHLALLYGEQGESEPLAIDVVTAQPAQEEAS